MTDSMFGPVQRWGHTPAPVQPAWLEETRSMWIDWDTNDNTPDRLKDVRLAARVGLLLGEIERLQDAARPPGEQLEWVPNERTGTSASRGYWRVRKTQP